MEFLKQSIYRRIILAFTGIILLMIVFSTAIYMRGISSIRDGITQILIEQNTNMVRNIQDEHRQIRLMEHQLIHLEDITALLLLDIRQGVGVAQDRQAIIQKIQNGILNIWMGNSLIHEVSIIIPQADLVLNTASVASVHEDWQQLLEQIEQLPSGTMADFAGDIAISSTTSAPIYYVYISLNSSVLETLLGRFQREVTGINLLYDHRNGNIVGQSVTPAVEEIIKNYFAANDRGGINESFGHLFYISDIRNSQFSLVTIVENRSINQQMSVFRYIYIALLLVILICGVWFWRKMFRPMQILVTENSRKEVLLEKAKFKQLQSQISPHFFYNSFITLSNRIAAEDYEFAAQFSRELGQYFMFLTRSGREHISLAEEWEHARTYMNIQSTRFRNRVMLEVEQLPERFRNTPVPRLILQPVIENAFKYAVEPSDSTVILRLEFKEMENSLYIIIENSGEIEACQLVRMQSKLEHVEGEIHGLANIHQRLQLISPNDGLLLGKSELGGLQVIIKISDYKD
jgi:two-component system sensor histidine kinase YesM